MQLVQTKTKLVWLLFGAAALLVAALAGWAIWSTNSGNAPWSSSADPSTDGDIARSPDEMADLAALPATAKDDAVIISELAPQDARGRNAAIPIGAGKLAPAKPFIFRGSAQDRARARECLALAAMAEAGSGDADQRAVIQVILNRTRHPGFTNTVCGVVFEGSERRTGCQFTFTCDGSLSRPYPAARWSAARKRADEMLGGAVYAPVGNATHYHTDWVFPWWSPKLDKIAQVGTHLFHRWRGFWGTPAAMNQPYRGGEPDPIGLRREASEVERGDLDLLPVDLNAVTTITTEQVDSGADRSPSPYVHFITITRGTRPNAVLQRARALCPGTAYCQVYGWAPGDTRPVTLPVTGQARANLRFSMVAGRLNSREIGLFDCAMFPDAPAGSCIPRPVGSGAARPPGANRPTASVPAAPANTPAPDTVPETSGIKADQAGTLKPQF